ncbi:MAG: hypothetical protein FWH10_07545 [Oscillospiraceae bacterium]|nr:hypothetical protein [Oscillospiraceae bacterium]
MKRSTKIFAFILAVLALLILAACGDETAGVNSENEEALQPEQDLQDIQDLPQGEYQPEQPQSPESDGRIDENSGISNSGDNNPGVSNTDENIEIYTDGEATVTVNYSAQTITIRYTANQGHTYYREFTQSDNVISAYIDAGIVEAPDLSYQGQEYFVTATIDGNTMVYEEVFVLTRDPGSSRSISVVVPELSFSAVLTRVE